MIQRIQTIFLILFIASLIATYFFPVWQKIEFSEENSPEIMATGFISSSYIENISEGNAEVHDYFYIPGITVSYTHLTLTTICSV